MKKLLAVLLVAATLFACGAKTAEPTATTTKGEYQSEAGEDGSYTTCSVELTDGKISAVSFDVFYGPKDAFKKALGDEYGMKVASTIGKEWFEQIDAFEKYCVGKTAEEVAATPLKVVGDHDSVADVADLETSCTMNVGDFISALAGAVAAAK